MTYEFIQTYPKEIAVLYTDIVTIRLHPLQKWNCTYLKEKEKYTMNYKNISLKLEKEDVYKYFEMGDQDETRRIF